MREAWDDLIADMQAARDVIDNPESSAPELTSRVLAEGYRYLTGFLHHGIERTFHADPRFPAFRNALSIFNKSTIENTDAIYFYAPIDGRYRYRITGRVQAHAHWRGEPRASSGPYAPQYVIFETADGKHIAIGLFENKFWKQLAEMMGGDFPELRREDYANTRLRNARITDCGY